MGFVAMPNKRQEGFCRDEFDRWLKGNYRVSTTWEPEVNDPPDFWLTLDGAKYAVEVTRILNEDDRTSAFEPNLRDFSEGVSLRNPISPARPTVRQFFFCTIFTASLMKTYSLIVSSEFPKQGCSTPFTWYRI